jgi:hypothetical protein
MPRGCSLKGPSQAGVEGSGSAAGVVPKDLVQPYIALFEDPLEDAGDIELNRP